MNTGAMSMLETAWHAGVEVCFANPGTTEMPLVTALDQVRGIRSVLAVFEGVCTGAADGWARMTGRPAATLLHLGPGLANGLANLHNARRGRTPVINWIGDHATCHRAFDTPLTSDIETLANTVGWTRSVTSAQDMADASLAAVEAALGPPGRVASLILPSDCQWGAGPSPLAIKPDPEPVGLARGAVREAAHLVRSRASGLLLGGTALTEAGLRAAARVAAGTNCRVWTETFPARQACGRHLPQFPPLPYPSAQARTALANLRSLILAGARTPVAFFAYPDEDAWVVPQDARVHVLADPDAGVDATLALETLADELDTPPRVTAPRTPPALVPTGQPLTPDRLCGLLAAGMPDQAILVNESATTGLTWTAVHGATAAPHTMLFLTGGAIGQGLPNALGAALACPDRRVIAYQADGSGLYTLQALWSIAREGVNVTVVLCANRRYRVLQGELARATADAGPRARALTELAPPVIDWAALAKGFGLPACTVHTDNDFAAAFARGVAEPGPCLIEAVLT